MTSPAEKPETPNRETAFVAATIQRCQEDKGLAARLRRADNPATEYQSWEWLAQKPWSVDLEKPWERLPYATIVAAIARAKPNANGSLRLGHAISESFRTDPNREQAKARLRRLLACNDTAEACRILRPTLKLIESRVAQSLDYSRLLKQLRSFHNDAERIRAQWAQEFYRQPTTEETSA